MALGKPKKKMMLDLNVVPMIDITSFILLSLAILNMSMKKEASLDNILKLPPVLHASKQNNTQLQIYVLPAAILKGGYVHPDSTGLVAFMDKSQVPIECPFCKAPFRNEKREYIAGSLLDASGKPLAQLGAMEDKKDEAANAKKATEKPPAHTCAKCKGEISPYLKLDDIPKALKEKKKTLVDEWKNAENLSRAAKQVAPLNEKEIKEYEDGLPLMIKADDLAFYGRILQVVNMAMDTSCAIKKFAFVTLPEASLEAKKKDIMSGEKK
ncbi:MAG: biopolymer transporter ExbD [Fibrobacteres bacterium]|nr:biopolymer transporter ExbD [Fibrobacterota bacterium]